jgi:hypothetical protein
MKNLNVFLFAILVAIVTIGSCKKEEPDPCENITCQNAGVCNDGTCACPTGYSGTRCEIVDPCLNVTCLNGGTCNNGLCNCVLGYQGTTCNTETRAKYIGVFAINETCTSGQDTYSVTIATVANNVTAVTISNLYNQGVTVNGTVNSSGGISIPTQGFDAGTISGSISSSGDVSFIVTLGGSSDNCIFRINI